MNSGNDMLGGVQAMCRVAKRQLKTREEKRERKGRAVSLNKGIDQPTSRTVYQTDYQRTGVGAVTKDRLATVEETSRPSSS